MTALQEILASTLLAIWLCFSITILISSIQSFIFDRRREKRELKRMLRDMEYYEKRMKNFK